MLQTKLENLKIKNFEFIAKKHEGNNQNNDENNTRRDNRVYSLFDLFTPTTENLTYELNPEYNKENVPKGFKIPKFSNLKFKDFISQEISKLFNTCSPNGLVWSIDRNILSVTRDNDDPVYLYQFQ